MDSEMGGLMMPEESAMIGVEAMSDEQRSALHAWGMRMFTLGQHRVCDIERIKYDGRVLVLDDDSRWEVESLDVGTAGQWNVGDKVVMIDEEMYRLNEQDKVVVEED